MNTAVLVIDVQQGLCEGDDAAFEAPHTIARINQVTAKARAAGQPVIFIQHESGGGYLEHGSAGWQLAQGLEALPADLRMRKTAADSFHRTVLQDLLQQHGITELAICGMHTESGHSLAIDTSVDFTSATTSEPTFSCSSSTERVVMTEVTTPQGVCTSTRRRRRRAGSP
jgi:nicotinamidase-related amidase